MSASRRAGAPILARINDRFRRHETLGSLPVGGSSWDSTVGHDGEAMVILPFDFACAMQTIGDRRRYIKIGGSGRNALDFQIALHLGDLLQRQPAASFRVASRLRS
jgi:hypothetical protein